MPLRSLTQTDLPLVLSWRNTPSVRSNMYTQHEITEVGNLAWFTHLKNDSKAKWYIYEDAAGQMESVVYFTQLQPANQSAFLGWYSGENATCSFGTRTEFAALEKAFSEFGMYKLNCEVLISNTKVINLHKKFGFKEEGIFRDFHFDGQNYIDVVRLGILSSEWAAKREEIQNRIAELDALVDTSTARGGGRIVILTDEHSWMEPYVDDLEELWTAAGYDCQIANDVVDVDGVADFCFCLSFSQIVPAHVRARFKHTLVVHESDLPKGRGWAPMTWQILEGRQRILVTLIEAVDAVDAGPIYLQEWIELNGHELNPEWRQMQGKCTIQLCAEWVRRYPDVLSFAKLQAGTESYYQRRRPADSQLDITRPLREQFNLLRVVDNQKYPAFFEALGKRFALEIRKIEG